MNDYNQVGLFTLSTYFIYSKSTIDPPRSYLFSCLVDLVRFIISLCKRSYSVLELHNIFNYYDLLRSLELHKIITWRPLSVRGVHRAIVPLFLISWEHSFNFIISAIFLFVFVEFWFPFIVHVLVLSNSSGVRAPLHSPCGGKAHFLGFYGYFFIYFKSLRPAYSLFQRRQLLKSSP